jgi:hypothetical protein
VGLATRIRAGGWTVPAVCVGSAVLCATLDMNSAGWFGGYRFGFELLILNGLLTAAGLAVVCRRPRSGA